MLHKIIIIISFFALMFSACDNSKNKQDTKESEITDTIKSIELLYSYPKEDYIFFEDTIRKNQTFGKILNQYNLPFSRIYEITQSIKDTFDVRKLKIGRPFIILSKKAHSDSLARPKVFIYQQNPIQYTVIDFQDSIQVFYKEKNVSYKESIASVNIQKSLYQDIADRDLSPKLAMELSDIFAWTVDFFHINKGDAFNVIYDNVFIDDSVYTGLGKIYAAKFKYGSKDFYAFTYPIDSLGKRFGYFDEEGRTLRKQFLKSPLKFGRISSRYNMHRYIKLYGRVKPHLGTDFAAPTGTPIMATANGIVIKRGYSSGNGNYIKIKHNATYSTQYLHMSKFVKNVKVGTVVTQGQTIGYVGSTGHASGPHVCYRFWKYGKQVDALKEKMPPSKPIDSTRIEKYFNDINTIKNRLDSL